MNGRDQEIYSKALFRSISYSELKSELESRKINFSSSDVKAQKNNPKRK